MCEFKNVRALNISIVYSFRSLGSWRVDSQLVEVSGLRSATSAFARLSLRGGFALKGVRFRWARFTVPRRDKRFGDAGMHRSCIPDHRFLVSCSNLYVQVFDCACTQFVSSYFEMSVTCFVVFARTFFRVLVVDF